MFGRTSYDTCRQYSMPYLKISFLPNTLIEYLLDTNSKYNNLPEGGSKNST